MMGIDPSHLAALHVLLEEGHVTRAAARLGITQSSMSHRLARLREALGDPLFVRSGARLIPTPRAATLAAPLARALAALDAAVASPAPFDPATTTLAVTVALPDLLASAVARLTASFAERAPRARLRFVGIPPNLPSWLAEATPSIALVPDRFLDASTITRPLGELRFGVAARRRHPALRRPLTVERWLALGHVVVGTGNERGNVIDEALARRGLERRAGVEIPSFLMGLLAVASSDLVMNVPLPLAAPAAHQLGLVVRPAPIDLPAVRFAIGWHERFQHDPGHRWVRERIASALRPAFDPA
jgi:DNA-binding transcriptional LysR family regulator